MGRSLVQEFITEDFKMPVQAVLDKALAGNETGNFEVSAVAYVCSQTVQHFLYFYWSNDVY